MRIPLAIAVSIVSLMSAVPASAQSERVISIAAEGASPPWDGTDANGQLYGYDIDVGQELCRRIEIKCTFVPQDWDGIIPALLVGKFDVIMSGMAITEKRKQSIAFSIPYATGFNQFVVRKDLGLVAGDTKEKVNLSTIGDKEKATIERLRSTLAGRAIGALRSSNSEAVVKEMLGDVVTIRSYDSQDNMKLDLAAGRIDGGLADYFTWRDFLETPSGSDVVFFGPELNGGLWGPGVGAGLRKDDTELLAKFNAAIDAATKDGTIKALSLKWFKSDISPAISQ
ncbi:MULTISPECIES: transporter substrate-binding domain-containing protein [unclassified Mesorhizobium]|uniref:transporter substrate-binding domain-containing protein n=1 Tax=unclassified Mesorhizobium TaxID=325217 RepID=UPI0003CE45B3|nr:MULTISPECIES: transporter substrate-binding domain-containing protein [unclassified Mesorhizobium]ESW81356.1 ABC transporter substrate-binding protein [Mesorhizobium sp. LSJC269B00]ESZ10092.1 ABC transporter substrate-binding protein [Mesorhizobium sp. L2C089B000]ESZ41660.1 ABC transporter substrate-binding protein [Mesorhizobium sp. L2C066B000]WJI52135.1 transporter substrate-binding domain-containing protein [Mesorhizobium sp. C089B]